jgi:GNAT superfamily N-acetyltransferase
MVTPEVMSRCHRSYVEAFWQWTKACPHAARRAIGGSGSAVLILGGIPSTTANVLFLLDPPGSVEPCLHEAEEFFGPRYPWRVLAMGSTPVDLERFAPRHRLRPAAAEPGMILDPVPPVPTPPRGLRVVTVTTDAELRDFAAVWCAAFGVPRWVFPLLLPAVPGDDPAWGAQTRLLLGYTGEQPVACSSVVVTERVANIVSVGTVPTARGHGYGASVTWEAVRAGRDLGADVAYLAASRMGYRVYERMGFRRAAEYPAWDTPTGLRHVLSFLRLWPVARRVRRAHAGLR